MSTWYDGCRVSRNFKQVTLKLFEDAYVGQGLKRCDAKIISGIPACPGGESGPEVDGEPEGDRTVREVIGNFMRPSTMTPPENTNAVQAVAHLDHTSTEDCPCASNSILRGCQPPQHTCDRAPHAPIEASRISKYKGSTRHTSYESSPA